LDSLLKTIVELEKSTSQRCEADIVTWRGMTTKVWLLYRELWYLILKHGLIDCSDHGCTVRFPEWVCKTSSATVSLLIDLKLQHEGDMLPSGRFLAAMLCRLELIKLSASREQCESAVDDSLRTKLMVVSSFIEEDHAAKLAEKKSQSARPSRPGEPSQDLMMYWGKFLV